MVVEDQVSTELVVLDLKLVLLLVVMEVMELVVAEAEAVVLHLLLVQQLK